MDFKYAFPFWVTAPMAFGGSLLGTFSDRLPLWWQDMGLYTGIILIIISFAGILWNSYKGNASIHWGLPPKFLITLLEAAIEAFEELKNSEWHRLELEKPENSIIKNQPGFIFHFYAIIISRNLDLFGKVYPSKERNKLEKSLIKDTDNVASDCTQFLDYTGASKITDLMVSKSELKAFINQRKRKDV